VRREKAPRSLDDWASQQGVEEESEGDVEGTSNGHAEHKTFRSRMREWKMETAPRRERWDFDEIRNTVIRENVWTALSKMPANSVDCVVTSPPYWNLRDYDGEEYTPIGGEVGCSHRFVDGECRRCGAWRGQLGHEPEPGMFVDNIVAIFARIRRVLKPSGSVFLNIGDNYAGTGESGDVDVPRKSMMMIPERVFLKMAECGWVLRNKIVWCKGILFDDDTVRGSPTPTSVADRINHAWEPVSWFTNGPDYYSDIFAVRREHATDVQKSGDYGGKFESDEYDEDAYNSLAARGAREGYTPSLQHEDGANIPDAWRVPTGKAGEEHPAVYSPRLCVRPIRMGCPKKVCDRCGKPLIRQTESGETVGWKRGCSHPNADTRPGVVFDPFCGRGTTLKVAADEGRDWVTTEVSDTYADFAEGYIGVGRQTKLGDMA